MKKCQLDTFSFNGKLTYDFLNIFSNSTNSLGFHIMKKIIVVATLLASSVNILSMKGDFVFPLTELSFHKKNSYLIQLSKELSPGLPVAPHKYYSDLTTLPRTAFGYPNNSCELLEYSVADRKARIEDLILLEENKLRFNKEASGANLEMLRAKLNAEVKQEYSHTLLIQEGKEKYRLRLFYDKETKKIIPRKYTCS